MQSESAGGNAFRGLQRLDSLPSQSADSDAMIISRAAENGAYNQIVLMLMMIFWAAETADADAKIY